jgi:hypothetical protein
MENLPAPVTFVTFTCRNDVSYARALLGSIAHFYPTHQIRVVLDTDVGRADQQQLARFPNVVVHRVADLVAHHKLNLTRLLAKLNVFLLPGVERALVADADSVLVDTVLDRVPDGTFFAGLTARPSNLDDPEARASFSRWAIDLDRMQQLGWAFRRSPVYFVGGSHFFIDVRRFPIGVLHDLLPHLGYDHSTTNPLRAGDQGFWTYLANICPVVTPEHMRLLDVAPEAVQEKVLRFPMANDPEWLAERKQKPFSFIHYIGFSRRLRRRDHHFHVALEWATRRYYEILGLPGGLARDEARRLSFLASKPLRRALARSCRALGR